VSDEERSVRRVSADTPGGARSFDHVGIQVPDVDTAAAFFVEAFGARVEFQMGRAAPGAAMGSERLGLAPDVQFALVMLDLGGSRVELLQFWPAPSAAPPPTADLPGGYHVAVEVDDVSVALEGLRLREGVVVVGEPVTFPVGATPGLTNAFVRTPWGALVELVAWNWPDN
jgi:catechol 2,3-dioxygenase-like lactoylglutathione lyase family enzyme